MSAFSVCKVNMLLSGTGAESALGPPVLVGTGLGMRELRAIVIFSNCALLTSGPYKARVGLMQPEPLTKLFAYLGRWVFGL